MKFVDTLRERIRDPRTDAEQIASMTSLLTCGFEVGGDNQKIVERWYAQIIANVDSFFEPMTNEQKKKLPDGVVCRLTDAKNEAIKYRDWLAERLGALAPSGKTGRCATCSDGDCATCGAV